MHIDFALCNYAHMLKLQSALLAAKHSGDVVIFLIFDSQMVASVIAL